VICSFRWHLAPADTRPSPGGTARQGSLLESVGSPNAALVRVPEASRYQQADHSGRAADHAHDPVHGQTPAHLESMPQALGRTDGGYVCAP